VEGGKGGKGRKEGGTGTFLPGLTPLCHHTTDKLKFSVFSFMSLTFLLLSGLDKSLS